MVLRGISNRGIESYLSNRQQFVSLEDCESDFQTVLCGVPQGSILGPKLFILYINDICNVSKILSFILFADDTNIFCSNNDLVQLCKTITCELSKLNTWFAVNKLSLNVSKTNFMLFGNLGEKNISVSISDQEIKRI